MTEPKFTPGPWQVNGSHIYTADPERALIAQVFNSSEKASDYPLSRNAHLIAAAPDLFNALLVAEESVGDLDSLEIVRAALAKARGESHD